MERKRIQINDMHQLSSANGIMVSGIRFRANQLTMTAAILSFYDLYNNAIMNLLDVAIT